MIIWISNIIIISIDTWVVYRVTRKFHLRLHFGKNQKILYQMLAQKTAPDKEESSRDAFLPLPRRLFMFVISCTTHVHHLTLTNNIHQVTKCMMQQTVN